MINKVLEESQKYAFASWTADAFIVRTDCVELSLHPTLEDAVRDTVKDLGRRAADITRSGGLFFGGGWDPFDASNPEVPEFSSTVFSACQALGVPAIFLTRHFGWAAEYPAYAAMLGVRRNIVAFGGSFNFTDQSIQSEYKSRISALKSLRAAGFVTWAFVDHITDFALARTIVRELMGNIDYLYVDVPTRYDASVAAAELSLEDDDSRLLDFVDEVSLLCDRAGIPWFGMLGLRSWLVSSGLPAEHDAFVVPFRKFAGTELVRPEAVDSVGAAEDAFREASEAVQQEVVRKSSE